MKRVYHSLAAVLATGLVAGPALSQVIYSDSFNRTTGSGDANGKPADPNNFSSWGANDNALGGTVTNNWLVGPTRGGGANQLTDGALASTIEGGAHYVYDVTAVAPLGFSVQFDFTRFHPFNPGTGTGFLAVGLGANTGATIGGGGFATANSDLSLVFQQGVGANVGNMQVLQDNAFLPGTGSEGPVDYGDPTVWHTVLLTIAPVVAGQYGDADVINGSVSIDGGTAYNFSFLGGTEFGNLAFSSNGFVNRAYDNLIVTAIPEPAGVAVAALGAFAAWRPRRRVR